MKVGAGPGGKGSRCSGDTVMVCHTRGEGKDRGCPSGRGDPRAVGLVGTAGLCKECSEANMAVLTLGFVHTTLISTQQKN